MGADIRRHERVRLIGQKIRRKCRDSGCVCGAFWIDSLGSGVVVERDGWGDGHMKWATGESCFGIEGDMGKKECVMQGGGIRARVCGVTCIRGETLAFGRTFAWLGSPRQVKNESIPRPVLLG
nr:hypothetical protein Iba_chr07dCG3740 [Ipomoea batatas]